MCVLDNTAQGLGQGKKPAHLEDSWQGAWSMEKEARREVGRDERSGIICRKEIFDRKPYIVPNRVMVKCELRDVIQTSTMIEVPLRISSPRKVTSPSHTFSSGQVHILARVL